MFEKMVNKIKMKYNKQQIQGNVYIPDNFEVEEEKKDVDANEK